MTRARRSAADVSTYNPPDPLTRRRMQCTPRRDTSCEVALRSELHRQGLRFRVDVPLLENRRFRADVVFAKARVAIYVDGCFWHGCPEHWTAPVHNASWWSGKVKANRRRDRRVNRELKSIGWLVLRFWEHEDPQVVACMVARVVMRRT
ncbi:MAG: mismatch endonuclease Vsr [Bryobacterales bacterium]|nr:mismatch endonuclease Vsr [Bryobacterales bacterium]